MRRLVYILLLMMAAATVACHRTPGEAERRLIDIDSLIASAPDSALTLLAALSPSPNPQPAGTSELSGTSGPSGSSGSSGDSSPSKLEGARGSVSASNVASPVRMTASERAYHALLTAQAMYKAYIPATTDSVINVAWDYYGHLGMFATTTDRQRRVRAMLYKGTTAEELGHPDSAMYWYKRTELEAAPDDQKIRAYSMFRQASLFQAQYDLPTAIARFKTATDAFMQCNDSIYAIYCIEELSAIYRLIDVDSALLYINKGISLAKKFKLNDEYYTQLTTLAGLYLSTNVTQSVEVARKVLNNSSNPINIFKCCHIASEAFCIRGNIDSAEFYINLSPKPTNAIDSVIHFQALSHLEELKQSMPEFKNSIAVSDSIAENLIIKSHKSSIRNSEYEVINEYNNEALFKSKLVKFLLLITIILILLSCFFIYRYKQQRTASLISSLRNDFSRHLRDIEEQKYELASNHIYLLKSIESKLNNNKNKSIISEIFDSERDNPVWDALRTHADTSCNGIITHIEKTYPTLSKKDIQLIILCCCGFSDKSIMSILDYTNQKSVYNRKRLLPSEKMNSDLSLTQFIEKYLENQVKRNVN